MGDVRELSAPAACLMPASEHGLIAQQKQQGLFASDVSFRAPSRTSLINMHYTHRKCFLPEDTQEGEMAGNHMPLAFIKRGSEGFVTAPGRPASREGIEGWSTGPGACLGLSWASRALGGFLGALR